MIYRQGVFGERRQRCPGFDCCPRSSGNEYPLAFEIHTQDGGRHVFDSFECAIHQLAPICEHCRCRIVGHGTEVDGHFFCCAHCARSAAMPAGEHIRDAVTTA